MSQILGIIPARFASTRFPGKPLAMLGNKPMIQWVCESASQVFEHLLVATDDRRILEAVERFGGRALMTSPDHGTGTERCAEAYRLYSEQSGLNFSHIVNIQGDEPLIQTEQLTALCDCLRDPAVVIATLIQPLRSQDDLNNPHVVKVVVDREFRALYFSRAPIPYLRDRQAGGPGRSHPFYSHIGLYAFQTGVLEQVVHLPPTDLERAESLEQLRWLEHGFTVHTRITHHPSMGVDTPDDLDALRRRI